MQSIIFKTKQTGLIPSEWLEERRRTKKIQKEAQRRQITKETSERLFSASKSQVRLVTTGSLHNYAIFLIADCRQNRTIMEFYDFSDNLHKNHQKSQIIVSASLYSSLYSFDFCFDSLKKRSHCKMRKRR